MGCLQLNRGYYRGFKGLRLRPSGFDPTSKDSRVRVKKQINTDKALSFEAVFFKNIFKKILWNKGRKDYVSMSYVSSCLHSLESSSPTKLEKNHK